jgi:hypothetical protein
MSVIQFSPKFRKREGEITMKTSATWFTLTYIGLIGVSLVFTNIGSAEIDPTSVVAAYLFDNEKADDVLIDWSGNRNHGEINRKVDYVEGKFGKAIHFNPGRKRICVDLGKPLLNDLQEFTLVAWVNRDAEDWTNSEGILGQHDAIEWMMTRRSTLMLRAYPTTETHKKKDVHVHPHDAAGCLNVKICISALLKLPGPDFKWEDEESWVHLAAIGDAAIMRNTRNAARGVQKRVNKLNIGPVTSYGASAHSTKIGGGGIFGPREGVPDFFSGSIDELAIFNVALSLDDIKTLMAEGLESIGLLGQAVEPAGKLSVTWGELKNGR